MKNIIYRFFSSPLIAVLLLLLFATAMGAATFIENDFGTATAWRLIYDSLWFELIMLGLGLCFLFNIPKYKLWRKQKWPVLLFHLAFLVILLGAGITRYGSTSGIMRIREGASSATIISSTNYFKVQLSDGNGAKVIKKQVDFSPLTKNNFTLTTEYRGQSFTIHLDKFVADAYPQVVASEEGEPLLEIVVGTETKGREKLILRRGEVETIGQHNHTIGFDSKVPTMIQFSSQDDSLLLKTTENLSTFIMATQVAGTFKKDSLQPVRMGSLHRAHDFSFVPMTFHPKGKFDLVSTSKKPKDNDSNLDDALVVRVSDGTVEKSIAMLYREGFEPTQHELDFDGVRATFSYGSEKIPIPFEILLDDFQLERYPGSTSPSSYASEVRVLDNGSQEAHRIFMNNVLDFKGYRFYQASYDTDELGTVLAVNQDRPGTMITYLGYLLMGLGMFFTLFGKHSRYRQINQKLKKLKKTQVAVLLLFSFSAFGFNGAPDSKRLQKQMIDLGQSEQFGRLLVQDLDGRIKPVNTLASEFLRKLSRKPYYKNGNVKLTANQAFLAMHIFPNDWQYLPIIKVDVEKGGEVLRKLEPNALGLVSFQSMLDDKGAYLLTDVVEKANLKKPAERTEFDKEILKVDERFNILYNIFSGSYLKIFPNKNDTNDTWYAANHHFEDFPEEDGAFARKILPAYFNDVIGGDMTAAYEKLSYIETYQKVLGEDIIPGERHINAELWYNKMNLNFWMFQAFFTLGFVMLVLAVVRIFLNSKLSSLLWNFCVILVLISFLSFTGNILLRWYVAGHAPWSNGYEMLVFVAWVLVLCGLIVFRKSDFALPLATLFSGALLFVSYLDWLNPEITNLMPVLKSYWLKIHVATIVSSYAPLALSAVLGMMALLLMIFRTAQNKDIFDVRIKELSYINEISMTIGLFVLAVGTFLGAVWANESWGRYWAWDPKETWALISIIVYAVVLHLRFIPGWNTHYVLNTASMFAFWSIVMTSFGVNYYLSGLHSYAAGDPLPIPNFVYVIAALMVLIAFVAYYKNRNISKTVIASP